MTVGGKSKELFSKAKQYMPGGVNSPVRAYNAVGMDPPFIAKGEGSRVFDVDGKEYIDHVCSWGPLILGHRPPKVVAALKDCLDNSGTSFGAPTELEVELAKLVVEAFPSVEMVRMVNSGTEATMSAIRLARAFTERKKIVKFIGCYHGHSDQFLIKAGSGALTMGVPDSPGVSDDVVANTLLVSYNDMEALKEVFKNEGENIAAVIVEPVAGNMGVVPPNEGFLEGLRKITKEYESLLIFDEVITGFRLSYGGAQGLFKIYPDLTCFGKIIGGGLPVGAYGGRRDIMERVAPSGPVYQAGTLSGNPLAMTAGIATISELGKPGVYEGLEQKSSNLSEGLANAARESGVEVTFNRVGSMMSMFFTKDKVRNLDTAGKSDLGMFTKYFKEMLNAGIYLAPSQYESMFVSTSHSDADIERTVEAARHAFSIIAGK